MSFGEEWAELVANARAGQSPSMRLNHAPSPDQGSGGGNGGGRGPGKGLHVTPHVLRTFAGKAEKVSDDFQKTDNETMAETEQVPGSMKGFASDEAFKDFQEMWRGQMRYLDGLYTGVAKALRAAAKTFKAEDVRRKAEIDKAVPDGQGLNKGPVYGPFVNGAEKPVYGPFVSPPPTPESGVPAPGAQGPALPPVTPEPTS
ncbi:WXG100 family type VII secretion target [Streptomyces tubbatahanensis]|uniref:WXG100 family type VII secretion target n=1 Tax=Streptomyces tubbatahanensis TaxID=2923272 RepID=UPI00311B2066